MATLSIPEIFVAQQSAGSSIVSAMLREVAPPRVFIAIAAVMSFAMVLSPRMGD